MKVGYILAFVLAVVLIGCSNIYKPGNITGPSSGNDPPGEPRSICASVSSEYIDHVTDYYPDLMPTDSVFIIGYPGWNGQWSGKIFLCLVQNLDILQWEMSAIVGVTYNRLALVLGGRVSPEGIMLGSTLLTDYVYFPNDSLGMLGAKFTLRPYQNTDSVYVDAGEDDRALMGSACITYDGWCADTTYAGILNGPRADSLHQSYIMGNFTFNQVIPMKWDVQIQKYKIWARYMYMGTNFAYYLRITVAGQSPDWGVWGNEINNQELFHLGFGPYTDQYVYRFDMLPSGTVIQGPRNQKYVIQLGGG
jgi:hypothetical protein